MNCRRVGQLLSDQIDDLVTQRETGAVAAHLSHCGSCRRLRDELRAVSRALREPADLFPDPLAVRERPQATERATEASLQRRAIERWVAEGEGTRANGGYWIFAASRLTPLLPTRLGIAAAAGALVVVLGAPMLRWWDRTRARPPHLPTIAQRLPAGLLPPAPSLNKAAPQRPARQPLKRGTPSGDPTDQRGRNVRVRSAALERHTPESLPDHSALPRLAARPRPSRAAVDDITYVNRAPDPTSRPWATGTPGEWDRTEGRASRAVRAPDDFIRIPYPRLATTADQQVAAAAESYKREAAIVDPRLAREVTVQQKATALSDLCERLRADTGVQLAAGASVADEKVTLFCEKMPLRQVMRQLSRPFGYTWIRSGKTDEYKYELVQDLRSQLLEEELRNRDRNEALLSLEKEIEKYRPYLSLSPDEVLARAQTAPPAEKKVLENLGGGRPGLGLAWGITQMYFRLTPRQLAALRAGEELAYSQEPEWGEQRLPPDVARGVLQSLRTWRLSKTKDGYGGTEPDDPRGIPLTAIPEARALVNIKLSQTELGQFGLQGLVGYYIPHQAYSRSDNGPYAVGVSPRTLQPENAVVNAKFARDPALRPRVSLQPQPSCNVSPNSPADRGGTPEGEGKLREPKVTTADVLEALHRATGVPVIADFYTRLYKSDTVSIKNQSLFDALNRLCDTMRLRWSKEAGAGEAGAWLQLRSMTYYHDRLKEVPNRLLTRWAASRREHGMLSLEELVEIAQLPDAQLDGSSMAEGIRECWGLPEWDLARWWFVLANLRFLARLTPAQRQEAQSTSGLLFTKMSLAQQQAFYSRQLPGQPELHSLEELAGTALRVQYTQPGWFEWQPPGPDWFRWAVRPGPGREGRWLPVPVVQERTREAALRALRRVDPQMRAAVRAALQAAADRAGAPPSEVVPLLSLSDEAQIVPTRLDLRTIYIPGTAKDRLVIWSWNSQNVSDLD
jgi:Putative zinc-finger